MNKQKCKKTQHFKQIYSFYLVFFLRAFVQVKTNIRSYFGQALTITKTEFLGLLRRIPSVIYPACFVLMNSIRDDIMGKCRWLQLTAIRRVYSRGACLMPAQFIPISMMQACSDKLPPAKFTVTLLSRNLRNALAVHYKQKNKDAVHEEISKALEQYYSSTSPCFHKI